MHLTLSIYETLSEIPNILQISGLIVTAILLILAFIRYRRNIMLNRVVFSIDLFEDRDDDKLQLRFRSPLPPMDLLDLVDHDRFFKWHVMSAALQTTIDDPLIRMERDKMRRLQGAIQNTISALSPEGIFLADAATDQQSRVGKQGFERRRYYFAVTHERYGRIPSQKIRVIMVSAHNFENIELTENQIKEADVEEEHHRDRLNTEHMMRQEVRALTENIRDYELQLGQCAVATVDLYVPV